MRKLGIAVGVLGVFWLVYFWMSVALYPHVAAAMPTLKVVETLTLGSAVACAFSGKTVSRYWWAGVAAALLTFALIMARVSRSREWLEQSARSAELCANRVGRPSPRQHGSIQRRSAAVVPAKVESGFARTGDIATPPCSSD